MNPLGDEALAALPQWWAAAVLRARAERSPAEAGRASRA